MTISSRPTRTRPGLCLTAGLFALILLAGPSALAQSEATGACRALMMDFIARLKQTEVDAARDLIQAIDLQCPPHARIAARARLGLLVSRVARLSVEQGTPPDRVIRQAEAYLPFGDHWELRRLIGDLAMAAGDHDAATAHYFKALELIDDTVFTPDPPAPEIIVAVHDAASQALSLNQLPVSPTTRGGATAAYFGVSVRGVSVPRKTPQITFRTNTDELDAQGLLTVEELAPILRRETPASVVVIGHTDERGSDAHNMDLSRRRALALQRFIVASGFDGDVQARWCGERVPVPLSNPDGFSQEERWRLNRRVEVFYGQGGADGERYRACAR
jgi:outer membrane protein OmpA-like peptidoglycan-associated protein